MKIIPVEQIESRIHLIRGQRVMLDRDLASLYMVSTKALNQAVKRNNERFPTDFMFRLTEQEKNKVVTDCDHLSPIKFSSTLPFVFTEHGTLMLANVLKSRRAIRSSIQIVRAFNHLRQTLISHKDLTEKLRKLEKKYDHQFKIVFEAIQKLVQPPQTKRKPIGFKHRR